MYRPRLGEQFIVSDRHWLRANAIGKIIQITDHQNNTYLIEFEEAYPGGGIDG